MRSAGFSQALLQWRGISRRRNMVARLVCRAVVPSTSTSTVFAKDAPYSYSYASVFPKDSWLINSTVSRKVQFCPSSVSAQATMNFDQADPFGSNSTTFQAISGHCIAFQANAIWGDSIGPVVGSYRVYYTGTTLGHKHGRKH